MLAVPILLLLVVPPPALGAFAAARSDGTIPGQAGSQTYARSRPGIRYRCRSTTSPSAQRGTGAERWSATTWSWSVRGAGPDGGWYVTRAVLTCCAADAQSYPVRVVGDAEPRTADTWVEVSGRFVPPADPGRHTAAISANDVRPVSPPAQPYEQ